MKGAGASIQARLLIGLAVVAVCSTALLLVVVSLDSHVALGRLALDSGTAQIVYDHVLQPLVVFVVPTMLAVMLSIRHAIAPLRKAARRIAQAKGNERGFRLKIGKFPTEVQPFALAINSVLTQLDDLAARQEAFASDVAHELRTPLAIHLLELDRLESPARDRLKRSAQAMQRLIDQLLLLAQVDAAAASGIPKNTVDLNDVGAAVVALLAPGAIQRQCAISLERGGADCVVEGWREAIATALRNLVENAVRVTPPGGEVIVIVGQVRA